MGEKDGQTFAIGSPQWSGTGGTIDGGMYVSAKEGATGLFTVRAELDGFEAIAEVRVTSASKPPEETDDDDRAPRSRVIRWHGEFPPQKWMNFYTKVLSRFVAAPGLKLNVSFEVPVEADPDVTKAEDAGTQAGRLRVPPDGRHSPGASPVHVISTPSGDRGSPSNTRLPPQGSGAIGGWNDGGGGEMDTRVAIQGNSHAQPGGFPEAVSVARGSEVGVKSQKSRWRRDLGRRAGTSPI